MFKSRHPALLSCLAIYFAAFAPHSYAQTQRNYSDDDRLEAGSQTEVVHVLADKMRDFYVYPEVGEATAKALRKKLTDGGYDSLKYAVGLATALTHDLQAINHDRHLGVFYGALPYHGPDYIPTVESEAIRLQQLQDSNSGVGTVQMLAGNIGYIEIQAFELEKYAAQSYANAMVLLAESAALIFDMRYTRGGESEGVALLSSYLFDKRTHLGDDYGRDGKPVEQFWTTEKLSGPKFGQSKPVYVLMSRRTFSAAEEFGYNLKHAGRATLVGEVTGGGANGGDWRRLSDHFYAFIPDVRAVNPVTKTNWEGTGVEPNVLVPEQTALLTAQRLAVQAISATEKNSQKLQVLRARLSELDSELALVTAPTGQ